MVPRSISPAMAPRRPADRPDAQDRLHQRVHRTMASVSWGSRNLTSSPPRNVWMNLAGPAEEQIVKEHRPQPGI